MLSLLDKTVRTAKWYGEPLPETIKASVKETLNGDFVLNFTYPITDSGLFRELKEDFLVRSPVPVLGHQLFRIKKVNEGDTSLEVVAYHISDDIMTRFVFPFRCEQVACATALSSMVMASKSPLGDFSFTSDIVKNRTYTTDKEQTLYSTLLDGKHSIVGTWEGELVRDNLALSIKSDRGQDRGVVISTHYNLKKYQRTKESSQIVTRIHATSSFKQEGQDRETVLQVTVDSPLINSYPFINEVTYTNNNLRSRQELIEWASSKFRLEGIDKAKDAIIIEAFELDGQTVHLGDTVTLKSKLHGIDVRKKAIAYDFDPLAKNYRSITFDDKAGIGTGKTGGSLTTLANNLLDGNKRSEDVAVEIALENANRAFDAAFEKRQVAIDTAIEQAQSRGEVYADRLKASIDSDLSTVHQQMRQQEKEHQRTTRDLLAKAGVNTNLATDAKQKAEQAQTGATEALRRAAQAKLDAISEANRLVDSVQSLLTSRLTSQQTLINQTASGIEQLSTKLTEANGKLTSAETRIRQLVNEVSSKVSQTDFSNLKRTVEGHTTSIQQTQQSILLKADKTVLEGVKTTADNALAKAATNASQITQTKADLRIANDAISQKVAKTDFNNLTGRVASAETTIRTQAGQIEQRLTSTQVESAINSKGYQTKSQVDSNISGRGYLTSSALAPYVTSTVLENKVRETTDSFTRRISQTESQIPRTVAHRNILAGTSDKWNAFQTITASTNWIVTLAKVHFGDVSGIYPGSKIHLYVHISADEITFDPGVSSRSIRLQGQILDNKNTWTWSNWNHYYPFYNKWYSNLTTGNNYRFIKLSTTVTQEMYSHSKGFEIQFRIDGVKTGKFHWRGLMVSTGDLAPDYWTPSLDDYTTVSAFYEVRDTVSGHTRTISDQTNQISQVIQTANGIVTRVGKLESSKATTATAQAIQIQVSALAGSWSVRNLTSSGTVLSQLNLNKDGSIKIDGKLIQITGTTSIQDGVISNAKIGSLDAGKITSGIISASRIGAEAITADKLKVDQAFFTKFMATDAYLKQLFGKSAFITQVQAVTLSANKISGGILSTLNGAMKINLSLGNIKFFTNSPSISREISGYPHQWVSFETGTSNGKPCGVTIIGSNRWNNWNANDGGFVGIRAWNGADTDQIDVVGDKVRLASAPYTNPDGWEIITLPNRLSIDAHKVSDRPSSVLNIGDVRIFRTSTSYVSLKDVLQQFNHNFKHLVNITGRGDVILTWDTIK